MVKAQDGFFRKGVSELRPLTKYREAIGIGSSVQRRRQKKLANAGPTAEILRFVHTGKRRQDRPDPGFLPVTRKTHLEIVSAANSLLTFFVETRRG